MVPKFALLACLLLAHYSYAVEQTETFHDGDYSFTYEVKDEKLHVTVSVKATGFVGVGFNSVSAEMVNAELVICGIKDAEEYFGAYKVSSSGDTHTPLEIENHKWEYTSITEENGVTTAVISRPLVVGTDGVLDFKDEEINLLWSYHPTSDEFGYHGLDTKGSMKLNLFEDRTPTGETDTPTSAPTSVPTGSTVAPTGSSAAPTGSTGSSEAPTGSTGSSEAPTGSTGSSEAPTGSTGSSEAPTGSTGSSEAPTGSTGSSEAPTGSTGSSEAPTGSTGSSEAPTDNTTTEGGASMMNFSAITTLVCIFVAKLF